MRRLSKIVQQLDRALRHLGFPLPGLILGTIVALWTNSAEDLVRKFLGQVLTETQVLLILFLIPIIGVLAAYKWIERQQQHKKFQPFMLIPGKKVLILLVSRPESAQFAIDYHFVTHRTLEQVWLIPSSNEYQREFGSSSLHIAQDIESYCQDLSQQQARSLHPRIYRPAVSPATAQDTFDAVKDIFNTCDRKPEDIVADFTGGTKPMSVGMIMACLPTRHNLEYVSYNRNTGSHGPFLVDYQRSAFDLE